jgi:futalosine hydrolase
MGPTIVTASTDQELSLLVRTGGARELPSTGRRQVYACEIGGIPVYLALTGIGKINAAATTAWLIDRFCPSLIINTGCAGAYPGSGLAIGEIALAESEILGDEGVLSPLGWEPLDAIGIPSLEREGVRYFNEFPLSPVPASRAAVLAESRGVSLRRGRFVTVSTCSGTAARGAELVGRFNALCENMEGAAVAQVALAWGVDCMEVRGISNMVEDRDLSRWDIRRAVENAQRFILAYLESTAGAISA